MDPVVTDDEKTDMMRAVALAAAKRVDERINIHDFRFVDGVTHKNLIFDAAAPFELKLTNHEIETRIEAEIQAADPKCFAVITVDRY